MSTVNGTLLALALVADGMGGLHAGDEASTIARDVALSYWKNHHLEFVSTTNPGSLLDTFKEANLQIYIKSRHSNKTMGTTLSLLTLWSGCYYIFHVGDTRIYQIRLDDDDKTETLNGQQDYGYWNITQLTKDDSWVAEEVLKGGMTEEEARVHPKRNLLTRCLGAKPDVVAYCTEGEYLPGDYFILCSDGFYSCFTEGQIVDMIQSNLAAGHSIQSIAENMAQNALKAGTRDNVTVILLGQSTEPANLISRIIRKIL